jgi:hypothetical protein
MVGNIEDKSFTKKALRGVRSVICPTDVCFKLNVVCLFMCETTPKHKVYNTILCSANDCLMHKRVAPAHDLMLVHYLIALNCVI